MSYWTYFYSRMIISSVEKIDPDKLSDKLYQYFGKVVDFDDCDEIWTDAFDIHPDDYLPIGSEGSLRYSGEKQIDDHHFKMCITGHLRDFCEEESLVRWFKNKIENLYEKLPGYGVESAESEASCIYLARWRYPDQDITVDKYVFS